MVKRNKFKGRKLEVDFRMECVERDVYSANDTPIAPYLNHALHHDAQLLIMTFLGDVPIRTAFYEDSMYFDEKTYCNKHYPDDFSIHDPHKSPR